MASMAGDAVADLRQHGIEFAHPLATSLAPRTAPSVRPPSPSWRVHFADSRRSPPHALAAVVGTAARVPAIVLRRRWLTHVAPPSTSQDGPAAVVARPDRPVRQGRVA